MTRLRMPSFNACRRLKAPRFAACKQLNRLAHTFSHVAARQLFDSASARNVLPLPSHIHLLSTLPQIQQYHSSAQHGYQCVPQTRCPAGMAPLTASADPEEIARTNIANMYQIVTDFDQSSLSNTTIRPSIRTEAA